MDNLKRWLASDVHVRASRTVGIDDVRADDSHPEYILQVLRQPSADAHTRGMLPHPVIMLAFCATFQPWPRTVNEPGHPRAWSQNGCVNCAWRRGLEPPPVKL